jgi:thiosulfate dehydrogenase
MPSVVARRTVTGVFLILAACGRGEQARRATSAKPAVSRRDSLVARGHALLAATHDSLPRYARANMRCFSCHLDDGQRTGAMPLRGAYARLPAYQPRAGRVITIEDRVDNCFTRSLAGSPLPAGGRDMAAIVAYLRTLTAPARDPSAARGEPAANVAFAGNAERGRGEYARHCARCHGGDGNGATAPPLWGARSFGIGASLARVGRIAPFIRRNMPYDSAGTLDSATAADIAAYIVSKPRPDTPGKSGDWPRGDAPWDVPYATTGHRPFHASPPPLTLGRTPSQSSIIHSTEK